MPEEQRPDAPAPQGGPGDEPQGDPRSEPPAPSGKRIVFSGKDYEVPDDLYTVWQEREQAFQRKLTEQGQELGQLRRQVQTVQPPAPPAKPSDRFDYNTKVFESPSEAFEYAIQQAKQQTIQEIVGLYQQQDTTARLWQSFYEANPDLKDADIIVKGVFNENPWLTNLDIDAGFPKLAELSRSVLLKLRGKSTDAPRQTMPQGRSAVEGGSGPKAPAAPSEEKPTAGGLGAVLRARRQAKREAYRQAARPTKKD